MTRNTSGLMRFKPNPKVSHLPTHAGVFGLYLDGVLVYVGSSHNVRNRCANYISINKNKSANRSVVAILDGNITFAVLEDCQYLSVEDRLSLESYHISINPRLLNKKKPVKESDPVVTTIANIGGEYEYFY